MTPSDLASLIVPWAKSLNDPIFNNRMAYDAIDCIGKPKDVSDALRYLFTQGKIARKKIDGYRYAYALIDKAPNDFERDLSSNKRVPKETIKEPAKETEADQPFLTLHLVDGSLRIPDNQESPAVTKQDSVQLTAFGACKDGIIYKIECIEAILDNAKKSAFNGNLMQAVSHIKMASIQCDFDRLLLNVMEILDSQNRPS